MRPNLVLSGRRPTRAFDFPRGRRYRDSGYRDSGCPVENDLAIIDIHCHCLPGVDDGPPTLEESVALCVALVEEGVREVVATPHALGRYDNRNTPATIRPAVEQLNAVLAEAGVPLKVLPGADARIDERMASLVESGELLTVADRGAYLLVELPHDALVPPRRLLADLKSIGVRAILTHPERHELLRNSEAAMQEWLAGDALLQVTTGSLSGAFGPEAQAAAIDWVDRGMVHIVASDAHGMDRRPPCWTEALAVLAEITDEESVRRLCIDNPRAIVRAGGRGRAS